MEEVKPEDVERKNNFVTIPLFLENMKHSVTFPFFYFISISLCLGDTLASELGVWLFLHSLVIAARFCATHSRSNVGIIILWY